MKYRMDDYDKGWIVVALAFSIILFVGGCQVDADCINLSINNTQLTCPIESGGNVGCSNNECVCIIQGRLNYGQTEVKIT